MYADLFHEENTFDDRMKVNLGLWGLPFVGCLFCQGWKTMLSFVVHNFLLYVSSL